MNYGYVRLSRDDDKKNYASIENQKLIIKQHAAMQGEVIDKWIEDDGVSGYTFNRPGLNALLSALKDHKDTVYAKDFSRVGRNNPRVLLLVDDFKERGIHLVIADDHYDSYDDHDDTLGITTWYNEKYVKDISKKIKSAIKARQKDGTLMSQVPFGYVRNSQKQDQIEIVPKESAIIQNIFNLYLQGYGYRRIGTMLTAQKAPTPSMAIRERELAVGKISRRRITTEWSDHMVSDILKNDFYIGNYRLNKRARKTVHGRDARVPKEEQILFEEHHEAIVSNTDFELVQDIMAKRVKSNYRGQGKQHNTFGSCLYCKDCGSRLTPVVRKTTKGVRKYYVCSAYNSKGKRCCAKAHLVEENTLVHDVTSYLQLCKNALADVITHYDMADLQTEEQSVADKQNALAKTIAEDKKQLKIIFSQKIKELTQSPENTDIINAAYTSLQEDLIAEIHDCEIKLNELSAAVPDNTGTKEKFSTALDVIDEIIRKENIDSKDVELLIEEIIVDENGFPDIRLKYGLSGLMHCNFPAELNQYENEVIETVLKLVRDTGQTFTSVKYLSRCLKQQVYHKPPNQIAPYINLMLDQHIIEKSDNPRKPYTILMNTEELDTYIQNFHSLSAGRWNATDGL